MPFVICNHSSLRNPPLNPLSYHVRTGILEGLAQAQLDNAVSYVVITGGDKQAFSAGADIKEMTDGQAVGRKPHLPAVVAAIEACKTPVVAAIGGVALGGGCEVCLHYYTLRTYRSLRVLSVYSINSINSIELL